MARRWLDAFPRSDSKRIGAFIDYGINGSNESEEGPRLFVLLFR